MPPWLPATLKTKIAAEAPFVGKLSRVEIVREGETTARAKLSPMSLERTLCPACQEQMRPVELGDLSIDECRFCDGLWLDRDEPEQLAKMDVIGKHLLQPMTFDDSRRKSPEGNRLCPRCGIRLEIHVHKGLSLDICGSCRGMFLDRWELQELFK